MFKQYANKQIALPSDHGSWIFLFSPLLIGITAGGQFSNTQLWLVVSLLSVFLLRQPASILVKSMSGRRTKKDQPAAVFWICVYGLIGLIGGFALILQKAVYIFWLALPGLLVFGWHLWLVSKRRERRQMGVDVLASGTLALAAPAAYWISAGGIDPVGWWLWILTWLQSAASIVYAFLRLEQRELKAEPGDKNKLQMGRRALMYGGFNLGLAAVAAAVGWLPIWIWIPYLVQFVEVVWGTFRPAIGWKPTSIGLRQLAVSSIFTLLFMLLW
ncbi:MAG: YwiC-like family protein [Anaerolineales bacterium]|nr:YwiC-like family protein [Anaerolineales bacterium]